VLPLPDLDVSKLHDKLVFQSESAHEVRTELSGMLTEHALALGRGRVDTQLFACGLQDVRIMKLRYGAQVHIRAQAFDGFSLVQTPLRGAFEAYTEGVNCRVAAGEVAVLSPRRDIDIHWQQGSEQIIVKIPHSLIRPLQASVFQSPVFKLHPGLVPLWHALVQQAINLSDGWSNDPTLALNPEWLAQFERTLSRFVVTHQDRIPGSVLRKSARRSFPVVPSPAPCTPLPQACARAHKDAAHEADAHDENAHGTDTPLVRMQAYIRQRLCAPISLRDLAQAAGLSPRSLNTLCHRHHGLSPMIMLRNHRLDEVRRALMKAPGRAQVNVTAIALDHGFGHLGRFSAYYRQRFGELPRETAARAGR